MSSQDCREEQRTAALLYQSICLGKLRKKQEKAEKKKAESIRPDQSGAKNAPLKTVPSLLERKFADFNYKFAYLIPETVHPNTVTTFGIIAGLLGSLCFFICWK